MKKYSYHIQGMHCNACKILVEDVVEEIIQGSKTQVVMKEKIVTIEMPEEVDAWKIFPLIAEKLSSHGYTLSLEKNTSEKDGILWQAIPVGLIFLGVFFMLQKSGILNFGIGGQVTPVTSFLIGLIASVSSCLAVVGGLVLSLSAKISQDSVSDRKNIVLFHTARILSFWLLGWLLGALWHIIEINQFFTSLLGIFAAFVMILLGADLIGILNHSKITLPTNIFQIFKKIEHKTFTPIIIWFGTFFLPCGFTQSMQIAALSSGSFFIGGLIMLSFALGTFPVLALLSFGAEGFSKSTYAPLFFKSAGVVVLWLGIFAFLAWLAWLGIISSTY
jgi:sulfite exporter TauE/SafE/copper chaperone CopZ